MHVGIVVADIFWQPCLIELLLAKYIVPYQGKVCSQLAKFSVLFTLILKFRHIYFVWLIYETLLLGDALATASIAIKSRVNFKVWGSIARSSSFVCIVMHVSHTYIRAYYDHVGPTEDLLVLLLLLALVSHRPVLSSYSYSRASFNKVCL